MNKEKLLWAAVIISLLWSSALGVLQWHQAKDIAVVSESVSAVSDQLQKIATTNKQPTSATTTHESQNSPLMSGSYTVYSKTTTASGLKQVFVLMQPFVGSEDNLTVFVKRIIKEVATKEGPELYIFILDDETSLKTFSKPEGVTKKEGEVIGRHWVAFYVGDFASANNRFTLKMYPTTFPATEVHYNPAEN